MTELLSPDSLELLENALANLIADQTVYISDIDFKKLTGDEITEFGSEGRLMMGNLAAATNCTIDTTGGTAIFTKRQQECGLRSANRERTPISWRPPCFRRDSVTRAKVNCSNSTDLAPVQVWPGLSRHSN
jgi:hypothetical protein